MFTPKNTNRVPTLQINININTSLSIQCDAKQQTNNGFREQGKTK